MIALFEAYRDRRTAEKILQKIRELAPGRKMKVMHVCGSHELTVTKYGLRSILPGWLEIISGPGCPVCITPAAEIDGAIELAKRGIMITTFGDLLRVPGTRSSLADVRTEGAVVRVVYSTSDAVEMARRNPQREVVHVAIGFETTAPTTAAEVLHKPPRNFSLLVCHRLIPPVMELLLGVGDLQIEGYIAPGHVSTIIGTNPYEIFPHAYRMPVVVAGFEPLDVLLALLGLVKQVNGGVARLENEYTRSVTREGNLKAQRLIAEVFDVVEGHWRGIGRIPDSALELKEGLSAYDAKKKYGLKAGPSRDLLPGCLCHLVMIGKIYPPECPLYAKACSPQSPKGPCMVSSEGTCKIAYEHGRSV